MSRNRRLFLDICAAFDTANIPAINYIIKYLFSDEFYKNFANFYHGGTARILIGNLISELILLNDGIGQGDNCSSPKFLLLHHVFQFIFMRFLIKR